MSDDIQDTPKNDDQNLVPVPDNYYVASNAKDQETGTIKNNNGNAFQVIV